MTGTPDTPAVTALTPGGGAVRVHAYQDGDYVLADVRDVFGLGRVEESEDGNTVLVLRGNEVRQLKSLAYTHSFDCEEGFIELCLRVKSARNPLPVGPLRQFYQVFTSAH
jgi:hypothetical protein